jgi:hypothetical protein
MVDGVTASVGGRLSMCSWSLDRLGVGSPSTCMYDRDTLYNIRIFHGPRSSAVGPLALAALNQPGSEGKPSSSVPGKDSTG